MKDAICVKNLTKKYGNFKAVNSINLSIKEGEFFGLLGPNGAGKSTIINILATILKSTSGKAVVNGYDIEKDEKGVRKSIGIVFQEPSLDERLTGKENMELHAEIYNMPKDVKEKRIQELLELVGLEKRANDPTKIYSGGMRRRLEFARGLLHHPRILFLDEPTLGLDPQTRSHIWNYIKNIVMKEKITTIITTHYMEEADFLCNRIAIIDRGKIRVTGTPSELKESVGEDITVIKTSDNSSSFNTLRSFGHIEKTSDCIKITMKNGSRQIPKIVMALKKKKISIDSINLSKPTLNDVFLHYTGKEIRDEEENFLNTLTRLRFRGL